MASPEAWPTSLIRGTMAQAYTPAGDSSYTFETGGLDLRSHGCENIRPILEEHDNCST